MTEHPAISVIVPVFNEATRLRRNLEAILEQKDAPPFEVIYIDNHSADASWSLLQRFCEEHSNVRAVRLERRATVGAVRRLAVQLAKAEIIANMDSDCLPPVDWLAQSRRLAGNVGIVGFPVVPPNDLEYLHHKFQYRGSGQYLEGSLPHGCGALMRKDLIEKVGNFQDSRLGEDTSLFHAIENIGAEIVLLNSPPLLLLEKRTTLRDHLARYFQMGRNANRESKTIYILILALIVLDAGVAVAVWKLNLLLSILLAIIWIGMLTNPWRIAYYVRNFSYPKALLVRVLCFGVIKFLETGALLAGFVSTAGSVREPSRRRHAPV